MIYKGYRIEKQYLPGSDFKILISGVMVTRKPTEVDFYYAEELTTGFHTANCTNLAEMKDHINDLNKIEGLFQ